MIKVSYKTVSKDSKKPEETIINIFKGKLIVRYNIPNKASSVVDQMRNDGRKNVLHSRGTMIQIFPNKTEKQILSIVKKDIINGIYVAEKKTGKKLKIENLIIQEK